MFGLHRTYRNPEKAVAAFENLYLQGQRDYRTANISGFLAKCSPRIRDEVRKLIETMLLLKGASHRKGYFSELLTDMSNHAPVADLTERYVFPYPTDGISPMDALKEHSIIDEKEEIDEKLRIRSIQDENEN